MTRVAAVDLGTNSTRLLVADVRDGRLDEIARRLTITRLGEGVDQLHRLLPAAMARVHACLAGYRRELEALGATRALAVATSAVRDAENGNAFLEEIASHYDFTTRLLDGREEAELTFRGASSDRPLPDGTLLLDIGGGSTELLSGGPSGISFSSSLQIGCVRLTERFLATDPPAHTELQACARYVRGMLPRLDVEIAVGVAGTVTTAAALDLGLDIYDSARIHRHRIPRAAIDQITECLAALPLAERERVPGLEPARAPVIVAGLIILGEVMDAYGLDAIEASERDILHGIALLAAELAAH